MKLDTLIRRNGKNTALICFELQILSSVSIIREEERNGCHKTRKIEEQEWQLSHIMAQISKYKGRDEVWSNLEPKKASYLLRELVY